MKRVALPHKQVLRSRTVAGKSRQAPTRAMAGPNDAGFAWCSKAGWQKNTSKGWKGYMFHIGNPTQSGEKRPLDILQ